MSKGFAPITRCELSIPTVKIVVREVNGVDMLFTDDGKLIAGQTNAGHVYHTDIFTGGGDFEKKKCFRATFVFDGKTFYGGEPLEA